MPMGQTEEKLRGMGCTNDQRKRLMMAAKFGLGPLQQMGLAPGKSSDRRSRSRSPVRPGRAEAAVAAPPRPPPLPGPLGRASSSSSAAPPARVLPTIVAAAAGGQRSVQVLRQPLARTPAPSRGPDAKEDDEDVDAFLAGGRAMAAAAAQAQQAAMERARQVEAAAVSAAEQDRAREQEEILAAERDRARQDEERRRREAERRRQEEERAREEEEQRKEERRRARQEEKRRRKEEKARQRDQMRREAGDDVEDEDADGGHTSSEERERSRTRRPPPGGVFKQAFRADGSKRQHWGESVKGRVSHDYKGMSDADLERRFGLQQQQNSGEKLMTEAEVLAMLKRGRG